MALQTMSSLRGGVLGVDALDLSATHTGLEKIGFGPILQADFVGTSGNDTIAGTTGDDYFDMSQGGADTVTGDAGDDTFFFGAAFTAADQIDGGTDTYYTPTGTGDVLTLAGNYGAGVTFSATTVQNVEIIVLNSSHNAGSPNSYTLTLNDGNVAAGQGMQISSGSGFNLLMANEPMIINGSAETDGDLVLIGGRANDTLTGGGGDDYIKGGAGDDIIDGGAGKDRAGFSGAPNAVTVSLLLQGAPQATGFGNDTLSHIEDLSGTQFGDTLAGDNNANWFLGNGGGDTINGNGGNDVIEPGEGGTATVNGGDGLDTLSFWDNSLASMSVGFSLASQGSVQNVGAFSINASNFENVEGTQYDDTITGDGAANVLYGDGGSDLLSGGAGNDTLYGDKGYYGSTGQFGGDGPAGMLDADSPGDDRLVGGAGNDKLYGGAGNDTAYYYDATSGVKVSLAIVGAQAVGGGLGSDTLDSIENLAGSAYDDKLTGDGGDNILNAGAGGVDTLAGGDGNDTFQFNETLTSADKADGGAGADTLVLNGDYSGGVTFGSGIVNIETVQVLAGHDYVLTTNNANVAAGQSLAIDGSALASGNTLNVNGSAEKDGALVLIGGAGADALSGGYGADTLQGGAGGDTLNGQRGADTFVYLSSADSTGVGLAFDHVLGFDFAQDRFDLATTVTGIDKKITKGSVSDATFVSDLSTVANAAHLAAGHAVLVTPAGGDEAGATFLVVDTNGTAGYQSDDLVVQLFTPAHLTSLDIGAFI